ncbi:MAG: glycosyltransferase family 4 protein [Pseudomonadota bacterium]
MQVLALVTEAFNARGGIQEFNRHWLTSLALGPANRVEVLATRGGDYESSGLRQRSVKGRWRYLAMARQALKQQPPDLLLCGHLSLLPLAAWLAGRHSLPLWLQLHGIEAWQRPASLWRRPGLARVSLVTAVSRYTRRRFLSWSNLPEHRVRILPNTVGEDCFAEPATGRPPREVPDRYLLSVGRLDAQERYKGHDQVIRVLSSVLQDQPDLHYVIAGSGSDLGRLEALAARCGVADRVVFLHAVTRAELHFLYRHAELFVLPSTGEGFGIVYLEALACGCPVLGLGQDGSADPLSLAGGTFVASEDMARSILKALRERTNRPADPAAVRERFGLPAFRAQVDALTAETMTQ